MTTLTDLPEDFELLRAGRTTAVVRRSAKDRLLAIGVLDEAALEQTRAQGQALGGGRGGAVSVALDPRSGERAVIRHFHRGGMLGRLLGDRYFSAARPLAEIGVSEAARAAGVSTPECLAAVIRGGFGFCRCDLILREIPQAVSLDQWLLESPPPKRLPDVRKAVAATFAKLFAANIYHPDLHAGNVLIQTDGDTVTAWVIDLDKARRAGVLGERLRNEMLFRFNRALVKRGLSPRPVSLIERARFCREIGVGQGEALRRFAEGCDAHLRRHSWRY